MAHNDDSTGLVNTGSNEGVNSGYVWGAAAIGKEIGRNPRQAHHLLHRGEIKCAMRKGGRWVANVAKLRAEFGG
jgi:hypothetical protein